jgi:hypothetical protein
MMVSDGFELETCKSAAAFGSRAILPIPAS